MESIWSIALGEEVYTVHGIRHNRAMVAEKVAMVNNHTFIRKGDRYYSTLVKGPSFHFTRVTTRSLLVLEGIALLGAFSKEQITVLKQQRELTSMAEREVWAADDLKVAAEKLGIDLPEYIKVLVEAKFAAAKQLGVSVR